MKYMFITLFAVVSMLILTSCSCAVAADTCEVKPGAKETKMAKMDGKSLKICGDCGELKGSEKCCAPDAEKCSKCGLNKGAPGCCKIEKGATDAKLCGHCGEIKGSDKCCVAEAEKCPKCGLNKGAPGCCKI